MTGDEGVSPLPGLPAAVELPQPSRLTLPQLHQLTLHHHHLYHSTHETDHPSKLQRGLLSSSADIVIIVIVVSLAHEIVILVKGVTNLRMTSGIAAPTNHTHKMTS